MKILALWAWDGYVFEGSTDPRDHYPEDPDGLHLHMRSPVNGSHLSEDLRFQVEAALDSWNKSCLTWVNP
jgi:hypothetical protein